MVNPEMPDRVGGAGFKVVPKPATLGCRRSWPGCWRLPGREERAQRLGWHIVLSASKSARSERIVAAIAGVMSSSCSRTSAGRPFQLAWVIESRLKRSPRRVVSEIVSPSGVTPGFLGREEVSSTPRGGI